MDKSDVAKATYCPKCGLKASSLLHRFCTHKECPVRDALKAAPRTDMDKSTPRPWLSERLPLHQYEGLTGDIDSIRDVNGYEFAASSSAEARAAIIRSVNAFDALVEALRRVRERSYSPFLNKICDDALALAAQGAAQATKETP